MEKLIQIFILIANFDNFRNLGNNANPKVERALTGGSSLWRLEYIQVKKN